MRILTLSVLFVVVAAHNLFAWVGFGVGRTSSGNYRDIYSGQTFNNPQSALMAGMLHNDMMQDMILGKKVRQKIKEQQQGSATAPKRPADFRLTDFVASRNTVAERFVKETDGLTAKERRELLVALKDGMTAVEKELPRKNNIAYIMVGLLWTSISIAKGVELPDEEVEALAAVFNEALGSNLEWKKAPASQKQLLYESALLNIVLMMMGNEAEDQETKDVTMQTARDIQTSFGIEE